MRRVEESETFYKKPRGTLPTSQSEVLIRNSYTASHGVYGARRVFGDLREVGETCGRHRVERIMQTHKIRALRGYKAPRHIAGQSSLDRPQPPGARSRWTPSNTAWVTDITYIRTWQGLLYLAVVVDLFARKVMAGQ